LVDARNFKFFEIFVNSGKFHMLTTHQFPFLLGGQCWKMRAQKPNSHVLLSIKKTIKWVLNSQFAKKVMVWWDMISYDHITAAIPLVPAYHRSENFAYIPCLLSGWYSKKEGCVENWPTMIKIENQNSLLAFGEVNSIGLIRLCLKL